MLGMNKRVFSNGTTVSVERTRLHKDGSFHLELVKGRGEWPSDEELLAAYAPGRRGSVRNQDWRDADLYAGPPRGAERSTDE